MSWKKHIIVRCALWGAAVCAFVLFFFGENWPMAFYLMFEGAVIGAAIGGAVGVIVMKA